MDGAPGRILILAVPVVGLAQLLDAEGLAAHGAIAAGTPRRYGEHTAEPLPPLLTMVGDGLLLL